MKTYKELAEGEAIVAMTNLNGRVIVATSFHIYEIIGGELHEMRFAYDPDPASVRTPGVGMYVATSSDDSPANVTAGGTGGGL